MADKSDRKELERRLAQARRMAAEPTDPLTKERLEKLVRDLEEQLRATEPGFKSSKTDSFRFKKCTFRAGIAETVCLGERTFKVAEELPPHPPSPPFGPACIVPLGGAVLSSDTSVSFHRGV
jgi:hypothetical protein